MKPVPVNVSPLAAPLRVDRALLVGLRRRELRADEAARSWGGLQFEATLDVATFEERRK